MDNPFHAPMNAPGEVAPDAGHRFENRYPDFMRPLDEPDPRAPRDPFVALTFSGGGTRAAALSYGVLDVLRRALIHPRGDKSRILDCVEVISSVSGGSFTAAYHGLFGDRIFDDAEDGYCRTMLFADLETALLGKALLPWNQARLLSPELDRIDLAAEVYERYFGNGTYADLAAGAAPVDPGRRAPPFVVLNATNMALGARFEFTQYQLDMLGSDLETFRVSRAVAASSAFPVAFSPLTLANYGAPRSFDWRPYETGALDASLNLDRFRESMVSLAYRDVEAHPHVHLLDGGLADNTGARYLLSSMRRDRGTLKKLLAGGAVETLAIIMVNARGAPDAAIDRDRTGPGIVRVLLAMGTVAVDNYVDESVMAVESEIRGFAEENRRRYEEERGEPWQDPEPPDPRVIRFPVLVDFEGRTWVRVVSVHVVHVTFEALGGEQRIAMLRVPTCFNIGEACAQEVIASAEALLEQNAVFQAFAARVARPGTPAVQLPERPR